MQADERLAVYGTLAPGCKNHWVLEGLSGTWRRGTVRGRLHQEGWGATEGFPAMVFDDDGQEIPVLVFESGQLPAEWARIDEFEGPDYRRIVVPVKMANGVFMQCCIYELNPDK